MSEEEAALERAGGGLWAMVRSLGFISREIEIHVRIITEEWHDFLIPSFQHIYILNTNYTNPCGVSFSVRKYVVKPIIFFFSLTYAKGYDRRRT